MNEFKQWMNDCQGEWQKDPMFGKTEGRGTKLIDIDRKAYVDAQLAMLNNQSPLYAQHMNQATWLTSSAQTASTVWEFTVTKPRARILDPDFIYTPAASTDVTNTWRKHGWVPLAEVAK